MWRLKGTSIVGKSEEIAMPAPPEDEMRKENSFLLVQDELRKMNAEIASIRSKYHNVVYVFILFLVALVAGKILIQ